MNPETPAGPWRKSSRSGGSGGSCVQARTSVGGVNVDIGDSKILGDATPTLTLSPNDFAAFLKYVK